MSRRHGKKVRVGVRPVMIPRALVRAQVAGEVVRHFNGSDEEVLCAQKGVTAGYIGEVLVCGLDLNGTTRDQVAISFGADQAGEIGLDLDGGKRAAVDALDGALSRSIQYAADKMRRRGLTPSIFFKFHDEIQGDAARLAACRAELGTTGVDTPQWRAGYRGQRIVRVKPAKDSGMSLDLLAEFFGPDED